MSPPGARRATGGDAEAVRQLRVPRGEFGTADNAVAEGRVRRLSRRTFGPPSPDGAAGASGSDGAASSDGSDGSDGSVSGVGPADGAAGSDSAAGASGGVDLDGGIGADGTGSAGPPR